MAYLLEAAAADLPQGALRWSPEEWGAAAELLIRHVVDISSPFQDDLDDGEEAAMAGLLLM